MKQKFNEDRILEWSIDEKTGKIPIFCVKPLKENANTKKAVLFVTGLNGNGSTVYYWNYPTFDDAYLVSYDGRGQATNTCKPSRFYKTYVKDINTIVESIKTKLNVEEVYLMGESCGSSLALLYNKYFPNKVSGIIIWNMPYKIKNISKGKKEHPIKRNLCTVLTFLFSIDTYDETPFVAELTNNKLLLRTIKVLRNNRLSNKVIISSWRAFKPSWRYLFKHLNELQKMNITYIQSKEDIMQDLKIVDKLINQNKNIYIFEKGYHILTFDDNVNDKLFEMITEIISHSGRGK